jgi:arsenical pump membrane protein
VDRYQPSGPHAPNDPILFWASGTGCLLFIIGILVGVPLGLASSISAGLAVLAFVVRDRATLRPGLLPWRLLVFVTGLFFVVQTIDRHGLNSVMHGLIGPDAGVVGAFRAAAAGAGLSNAVNNLPAYVAGEAVIPIGNHDQLLALLIGTNVGPVVTPWASLATLLWYERCRAHDVDVPLAKFMLTGAGLAAVGLAGTVTALLVTG